MKTQVEIEDMFKEEMGAFISSCDPENQSDVSNILIKMISLCSISFAGLVQDEKTILDILEQICEYAIKKKDFIKMVPVAAGYIQTKH